MILGRDKHIEIVRRGDFRLVRVVRALRHRRLHESGLAHVRHDETPWLIVGPFAGQSTELLAPRVCFVRNADTSATMQGDRGKLDDEAVPRRVLMRAEKGEIEDCIPRIRRKKRR